MRSLSAEEAELWARVATTIRPLSREKVQAPSLVEPPPPRRSAAPALPRPQPAPARTLPHSAATLDSTWDRKLRSGSITPDRVLDLHGRNLDQAWRAIDDGLERAIANDERVMLLITGHAPAGAPPIARGKIRAAVHDWLAASRHAGRIAAVRGAHRRHGGAGSLYIILRKPRLGSTFS
ncbi:MAG TPA: Smr/MutS family protein [Sphingomicrobium sp.]|nr:Smr/MutS family protein [Sphingomicrobium sp.]